MSGWELHGGCIPCAFVCHCCDTMKHRCGSGEDMWIYNRKSVYGEAERILCDECYYHKDRKCACQQSPGESPIEVDSSTGSRKARGKCGTCYYRGYPCANCLWYTKEEDETVMTYAEFLEDSENDIVKIYPDDYEDFLSQKQHPKAIHE